MFACSVYALLMMSQSIADDVTIQSRDLTIVVWSRESDIWLIAILSTDLFTAGLVINPNYFPYRLLINAFCQLTRLWISNHIWHTETETKWPPFHRWYFQMHIHERKCINLDLNFTKVGFQGSNWQYSIISSNNGLALARHKSIIWTNND